MGECRHHVRDHFDREAPAYDGLIARIIPGYHAQNEQLLTLLGRPARVLDLGCGTGVLAAGVLTRFPEAQVHALDLAPGMVEQCRANLARFGERATVAQGDFSAWTTPTTYDAVVSGLAIHHLPDAGKQDLFRRIRGWLRPGGVFVNRDIVLGETPAENQRLLDDWQAFMAAHGEEAAKWLAVHQREDLPARLSEQLRWLTESGFREVTIHGQWLHVVIYYAHS